MNYHLAILKGCYLDAILSGEKNIESRFTKTRRSPFGRISAGDKIFFKAVSGLVRAVGTVGAVKEFEGLTPGQMKELKAEYNGQIGGSDEYWRYKLGSRFGVLVWLKEVRAIEPVRIEKKDWRAWVELTEQENFGLI